MAEWITIKDGEILVPENTWKLVNTQYDRETIKEEIANAILNNNLPMPMVSITEKEAKDDFQKLCELECSEIIEESSFYSRYDYKYNYTDKICKLSKIGNKSSNYHHQYNRWLCDSINAPSPYRTWTQKRFLLTLLNALWGLKVKEINSATLRSCIGLRKYIASQFRPTTAKAIYNHFQAENVLDFSAGWGDRLSGFCASNAKTYTGIDPNKRLIDGYQKQVEWYGNGKTVDMISQGAEDCELGNKKFDLVFTSPPYFNVERYTQEENQSWKSYKGIDNWNENFLFKAIQNSWDHLEVGGHLIINISDVYSGHKINKICDPMNDYISSIGGYYMGAWGYQMAKRPNSKATKEAGKFAEPVWIWKK